MAFLNGKKAAIGLALASAVALGGCYDDGYGYGGISVGTGGYYGNGYYGDDYYGGYADGYYAGGYGYPSYGWYDGFYYPGSGFYIYDRGGTRYRWNDNTRRYWEGRRAQAGNQGGGDGRWNGAGRQGNGAWNGGNRAGDGRWDGANRSDGQRSGGWNGQWNGRGDRAGAQSGAAQPGTVQPGTTQPGTSGGFGGRQRNWGAADGGMATPQAARPQMDRQQGFTPRAEQSRRNAGMGYRGRNRD